MGTEPQHWRRSPTLAGPYAAPRAGSAFGSKHQNLAFDDRLAKIADFLYPDASALDLRRQVDTRGWSETVDFESASDCITFNRAYFFRNLAKCISAANNAQFAPKSNLPVIDVGSGAGTFALALALNTSQQRLMTVAIDRSRYQRMLALEVARLSSRPFDDYLVERFPSSSIPRSSTRLMSYWLCENRQLLDSSAQCLHDVFGESAFIVDYPEVIEQATTHPWALKQNVRRGAFTIDLDDIWTKIVGQRYIAVAWAVFNAPG